MAFPDADIGVQLPPLASPGASGRTTLQPVWAIIGLLLYATSHGRCMRGTVTRTKWAAKDCSVDATPPTCVNADARRINVSCTNYRPSAVRDIFALRQLLRQLLCPNATSQIPVEVFCCVLSSSSQLRIGQSTCGRLAVASKIGRGRIRSLEPTWELWLHAGGRKP